MCYICSVITERSAPRTRQCAASECIVCILCRPMSECMCIWVAQVAGLSNRSRWAISQLTAVEQHWQWHFMTCDAPHPAAAAHFVTSVTAADRRSATVALCMHCVVTWSCCQLCLLVTGVLRAILSLSLLPFMRFHNKVGNNVISWLFSNSTCRRQINVNRWTKFQWEYEVRTLCLLKIHITTITTGQVYYYCHVPLAAATTTNNNTTIYKAP